MGLVNPPFLPAHVSGGDDPDLVFPDGKDQEQQPVHIGLAECVKTVFGFRMPCIIPYNQWKIEECLFTFGWGNGMPHPDLFGIMIIPFKARTLSQNIVFHGV
jgi:hypothetical protein